MSILSVLQNSYVFSSLSHGFPPYMASATIFQDTSLVPLFDPQDVLQGPLLFSILQSTETKVCTRTEVHNLGDVPTFAILATKDSSIRYIDSNFPSKPIFKVTLFAFCRIISSVVEEIAGISQLAKFLAFLPVVHTCIEHLSKLLISILLP